MLAPDPNARHGPHSHLRDRLAGTLLGTALRDTLGLACEGMSSRSIARRFGTIDRFHLLGTTGFVSDDTEQSALVAQSLARHPDDQDRCVRAFRRALLGWFCRLPWGVGLATVRACLRIGLILSPSGVMSAGNGAAMRAAVVGVFFCEHADQRRRFGRALAQVTHRDERAVAGALFVAELAAGLASGAPGKNVEAIYLEARRAIDHSAFGEALDQAANRYAQSATTSDAARACGTTGYVLHTVPFAVFCFLRFANDPMRALSEAISAGGDTDSVAAIVGAWMGALHGENGLPTDLISRVHDGPFGPSHLRSLANCLANICEGTECRVPRYSRIAALARNLALYPVILGHGFRRLFPI
jgi:ADP-ribosyl-[dinitrogen reductase] hydrolase